MATLGEKIFHQRKKNGLSQDELGYRVGVSRQTISKWETNSMQPSLENLKSLCLVLNVSINYFSSDNSDIDDCFAEIAASSDTNSDRNIDHIPQKKSSVGLIIGIASLTVFAIIMIFITVVLGKAVFTSNIGDYNTITSSGIDREVFFVVLAISIAIFLLDLALIILLIAKKCKCKVMVTKCKD